MSKKLKKELTNEYKTRFKHKSIIMVYYKYSKQQPRFSKKKLECINKTDRYIVLICCVSEITCWYDISVHRLVSNFNFDMSQILGIKFLLFFLNLIPKCNFQY